ncbi:MAG TPA: GxxExxY protein [Roseiflexaceae bacterium]|nr:GxxExxY protein [Roseiflexaceae bacterium]
MRTENNISKQIVASALEVHRTLGGPGLLEGVYEEALCWELEQSGLCVQRQIALPIAYKGVQLSHPLRLDLLVEQLVIVEVKSTTAYNSIYDAQALTYLRITNLRLALVINFGEKLVRDGIHRIVNQL